MAKLTVRFYELLSAPGAQLPDLDIDRLLDRVAAMPDTEAYVQLARMELLGSTHAADGRGRAPQCPLVVLDRISREVQLRIERGRRYRPLELQDGETIAEPTHFGLFPRNVVGIMRRSGAAPGPASFRDFLNTAGLLDEEITIRPLVDTNAGRALSNVGKLTRLDLEMDSENAAAVMGGTSYLNQAFRIFQDNLTHVGIEIVIKMSPKGPDATSESVFNEVRALNETGAFMGAERAKISYRSLEDGRADSYDFLNEAVAQAVEVEVDDDRNGPSNARASESIMEAYNKQHDDIQSALSSGGTVASSA